MTNLRVVNPPYDAHLKGAQQAVPLPIVIALYQNRGSLSREKFEYFRTIDDFLNPCETIFVRW